MTSQASHFRASFLSSDTGAIRYPKVRALVGDLPSERAAQKWRAACREKEIHLNGFPVEKNDLSGFEWTDLTRDRNWWWQIQSMPFLDWFVCAYDLLSTEEKSQGLAFAKKAISNWKSKAEANEAPLTWHDHAAALRLRNLVRWISFSALRELDLSEADYLGLVERHLGFLADEKNYTHHTNHGFDQAFIAYQTCLAWSGIPRVAAYSDLFRSRLQSEVEFAFTSQGVHKENSPGYQKGMTDRLQLLTGLKALGGHQMAEAGRKLHAQALDVVRVMTLPNGTLPMIGDTLHKRGIKESQWPVEEIADLAASGYVIARGTTTWGERYHLAFKCSHFSRYHRHDDDLSIHLVIEDEVILADAGLGHYDEKDGRRIALRSPKGHTTVFPVEANAIRQPEKLAQPPSLRFLDPNVIEGQTSMYGGRLCRTVDFSRLREGHLVIRDRWLDPIDAATQTSFLFTPGVRIQIEREKVCATTGDGRSICIRGTRSAEWALDNVPFSSEYGVYGSAPRLFLEYPSTTPGIEFSIQISPTR